ncbi:hypothetical protein D3Z50_07030 [Clostridiaceae bacterium]|nr:hypothetical protein [Clostridiaceae bacterium]
MYEEMTEERNRKPTFLFIKRNMEVGGIEVYMDRLVKWLKERGYRIIFLKLCGTVICDDFKADFLDGYVTVREIDIHCRRWHEGLEGIFHADEEIIAYAFDLYQYAMLEKIKVYYHLCHMNTFYWIPHFEEVFPEKKIPRILGKAAKGYIGRTIQTMDRNRNIIYVNESHMKAFERRYGYKSIYGKEMLVKSLRSVPPAFDEEKARGRSLRKPFCILSVGRFVFPHKAYLLGLIDSFCSLKSEEPDLKLIIIGYGRDEAIVRKKISEIPKAIRMDIELVGEVAPSGLEAYFDQASVHVGVAGAIMDSAYSGLVSIPVRHYCYQCEGYGYFVDMAQRERLVSDMPGKPIETFLKELIHMDADAYVDLCRQTQISYTNNEDYRDFGIREMNQRNVNSRQHLAKGFIAAAQLRYIIAGIWHRAGYKMKNGWRKEK